MLKDFDLSGKKAIVTGGASGLSRGIAEAFHDHGAEVAILDISPAGAAVAEEIQQDGAPVHFIRADLTDRAQLREKFFEALAALGGTVDILMNGAGVQKLNNLLDFTLEEWDFVLKINLDATFFLCQLAGREMIKQGHGKIINIASMNSFSGGTIIPAYTASKGGVLQLTKALCNEWAQYGLNVNAIAPGYMMTPLNAKITPDNPLYTYFKDRTPADRWGDANDVKGVAVFLASSASDFVNGTTAICDGGCMAR